MKTEFFIPIMPERQSSFWFCGVDTIAEFTKNDRYIKVEAVGEIIVEFFECKDEFYKGSRAVKFAWENNYTDDDLSRLFEEELFDYSNWFQFFFKKQKDGEWKEMIDSPIYSTIDEFTIAAEEYMSADDFWDNLEKYCY